MYIFRCAVQHTVRDLLTVSSQPVPGVWKLPVSVLSLLQPLTFTNTKPHSTMDITDNAFHKAFLMKSVFYSGPIFTYIVVIRIMLFLDFSLI